MSETPRLLHKYAVFVACCTAALIFAGGLVTSTGSGLAVPDWPLSFGTLFPEMRGGVVFEHGHRLIAGAVGLLTVGLAAWLWRREPRPWVRRLGGLALLAVVCQGILGGMTVLMKLPTVVSVGHAALAQLFFSLVVAIAIVTAPGWREASASKEKIRLSKIQTVRRLCVAATAAVYLQIVLGALMRHMGAGLAIPDFPLVFGGLVPPPDAWNRWVAVHFAHRVGAVATAVLVIWATVRALRSPCRSFLRKGAILAHVALFAQLLLGGTTIWTGKSILPTTGHVVGGSFLLAAMLWVTLRSYRFGEGAGPARKPIRVAAKRSAREVVAS